MTEPIYDEDDELFGHLSLKVNEDINHINLLCDKIDLLNEVYRTLAYIFTCTAILMN